uniref:TadE/TadG family type IV pilus assembly protein n=1 Tax=uncultured Altererythrobacter sp. TaxID=500840 RepID=UPI0026172D63|nr:pilus assembly protein TadG-related protein [uncultured Altererythrobacter sp.]
MIKERYKRFVRNADGAVAATYAIALIPLIAIAGLAFDYTRAVGLDTELQNAADQAALAGATQLDRRTGSMDRAINAIQGGLVANNTLFSNDGSGTTVAITDATVQIVFYSTRADAEAGTNGFTDTSRFADAGFVQVDVDTRDANFALTPIVGAVTGSLDASAVAGLGSALCRIPPLMVCNPDEVIGATNSDFDADARVGHGLLAKPGGGSKWSPGNYGYLDIGTNGATGVRQALGWDSPGGACLSQTGVDPEDADTVDTQTGNIASGPQAINTRFDVYSTQGCVSGGTCSPAFNVRKDLMRAVSADVDPDNTCDIHGSGWQEPPNAYHPTVAAAWPSTSPIDSMGHPRDICHAVPEPQGNGAPNGNCQDDPFGNGNWDRDAYFRTHYASGFNPNVIPKDPNAPNPSAPLTRYEVYKYEEANAATALVDTPAGASGTTLTTRNQAVCGPNAYSFSPAAAPVDRRRMTVAVINCDEHNVSGNSPDVPVRRWVDVFVVQPSYDRGQAGRWSKKDEIYVEIIGETDISRSGAPIGPTIRRDVPYLVR